MADIFKEVDEELRRDRATVFWKKHGRKVVGMAVAIVVAVAGFQGWQAYDVSRRQALSDTYAEARDLAAENTARGLEAMTALSDPAGGGYHGLAAFEEARLKVESGDPEGAIAIWDRITADSDLGAAFRGAAALLAVQYQIDDGDAAALRQRLVPLTAPGAPYRASALELSALIALREGDRQGARDRYTEIADDRAAPTGLRSRAAQMLSALKE